MANPPLLRAVQLSHRQYNGGVIRPRRRVHVCLTWRRKTSGPYRLGIIAPVMLAAVVWVLTPFHSIPRIRAQGRPSDPAAHLNDAGAALLCQGDARGAAAKFRAALQLDPADADAHLNLGRALFESDSLDAAIKEFQAAITLRPHDVRTPPHVRTGLPAPRGGTQRST